MNKSDTISTAATTPESAAGLLTTPTMTTTASPSSIRLADARATFPDGSEVSLKELESIEHAEQAADMARDDSWHTLVVATWWSEAAHGTVFMPEMIGVEDEAGNDHEDREYDRVAMIDNAIATLERARALLLAQQGATA